ncbi:ABC transporter substrate-binding protein [Paenibacillus athensensis]|uniref:PI-PLC Y-box domain-containing protein n=1 Tax=Paenibacillus athensensis TaxID=1967502 RepID=A0A4Y8Q8C6_9BACL|nr:ABC transporter substrate-binding protein [Paenibacillus athensensis]MCD1260335.1 ABC transporter substrate-binding protein [Paenibacillus athensensis]
MKSAIRFPAGRPVVWQFALTVMLLAASGCQSSSSLSGSPAASTLPPAHLVMVFPAGAVPRDLGLVQDEMNKYLQTKINATIELKLIDWEVWWDKTSYMFASREPFDLLFTAGWFGYSSEVAKGQILPVDDLLAKYGGSITRTLDPDILNAGKLNGKLYAVPTNKEFAASKGIVMRKDLVDKYGFDLSRVHALADLEPLLAAIKQQEPDMVPLLARADHSPVTTLIQYGYFDMLGDGPGVLDRSNGDLKVVNMYETDRYRELATLMHKWYTAGYINKDVLTEKTLESDVFRQGRAFAYADSLKPGFAQQVSRDTGMEMETVELTEPYMTTGDTTSAMFAISRTTSNPERSMMLLNLLYEDSYLLNLLDWGIEGKHYVKVSDQSIDYPPGETGKTIGYGLNQAWMFGNQMHSFLWANESPDLWEQFKAFNAEADHSPALGFVFNPEKVKSEIAACNLVDKEFGPTLHSGVVDPQSVLPTYLARLKAAGAERVIAEKQRQLDAWAADKAGK